ncbi:MAG: SLBB domain-containing protein [Ignavibacteriales bacterium]|nr:SLBB domain-containing protein [Ignavibacteriales bacterium]
MRSAVYELKSGEGLKDLVNFAGGLKITAYTGRVQIKRIKPFDQRQQFSLEREVIDVDYSKIMSGGSDFELFDGDEVTVYPILAQLENFVQLSGAVYRPGTFEYRKGLRISDLISEAYGLLPEAFQGKIDVTRERKDKTQEFLSLDLRAALTGDPNNNIFLQPKDSLRVYSIYDLESPRNVSINGYVKTPITIPYADSLTIFDMIFRAGGLQDPIFKGRAYTVRGDLIRINPDALTTTIIPFDLEKVLMNIGDNLALKPGDKISIYRLDVEKNVDEVVTIGGK